MTASEWVALILIGVLGHAMAFFWYNAKRQNWRICERTIYDLPIRDRQLRRELKNSIHTPIHSVIAALFLWLGFFNNASWTSFLLTLLATAVWAEIWHYCSHRAFHLKALRWIHAEHHKSLINTPLTAISFSFSEKLIFSLGILIPHAVADYFVSINFLGIAAWFVCYIVINSFSHANFELRAASYNRHLGKILTTTTYHALHHARYNGNYGLGTRVLDRLFGTEWQDYEPTYDRINTEKRPLSRFRERAKVREKIVPSSLEFDSRSKKRLVLTYTVSIVR